MEPKQILQEHFAKTISLTDQQFEYLFSFFQYQKFKKGQKIISEGDKVDCEYFVAEGCLKSFFINDELKMFILQFAMPTWWTSDFEALYAGTKATINVDCVTDAEVLCLTNANREKLCREIHQVEYFLDGEPTKVTSLCKKDCYRS